MRIRRFHIEGFGLFQDFEVKDLGDGLTLLVGPNEAGKSTLLHFLRWMLFGHHENRVPALRGQDGGRLWFEAGGAHYKLGRVPYRAQGSQVSLSLADGMRMDEAKLLPLLGHTDRAMFESVFAFTQFDLNSFKNLNQDQIRGRLFSAGIAGAGSEATAVLAKLEAERSQLLAPRSGLIRSLLNDLDDASRRLQAARQAAQGYPQAFGRVEELHSAIKVLASETEQLLQERTGLEHLLALWPTWLEARRVRESIAALPETPTMPEGARARHDALARVVAERKGMVEGAETEAGDAKADVLRLCPDPMLADIADEVAALQASVEAHRQTRQALAGLVGDRKQAQTDIDKALAELGWIRGRVVAFDRSLPVREAVRALEDKLAKAGTGLDEARRVAKEAEERHSSCVQQLETACGELEGLTEPPPAADLERKAHILRMLRGQITEGDRLAGRHEQVAQISRDLEAAHDACIRASAALAASPAAQDPEALGEQAARLRRLRADAAEHERLLIRAEKAQDLATALTEAHGDATAAEAALAGEAAPTTEALGDRRSALRRARSRLADALRARDLLETARARARETQAEVERSGRLVLPSWAPFVAVGLALVALLVAGWAQTTGHGDIRTGTALLGALGLGLAGAILAWQRRHAADLRDLAKRAEESQTARSRAAADLQRLEALLAEESAVLGLARTPDAVALDDVEAKLEADRERRLRQDAALTAGQDSLRRFAALAARAGLSAGSADPADRAALLVDATGLAKATRQTASGLQTAIAAVAREAGLDGGLTAARIEEAERSLASHQKAARDRELASASVVQAREHFAGMARARLIAFDAVAEDFEASADSALAQLRVAQQAARSDLAAQKADLLDSATQVGLPAVPGPLEIEQAVTEAGRELEGRRQYDARVAAEAKAQQQLAAAETARQQAHEAAQRAEGELREREETWAAWKAERSLPETLSPDGTIEFCERVKGAQDQIQTLDRVETRIVDCNSRWAAFEARVRNCFESIGEVPPEGQDALIDALLRLADRVKADQAVRVERDEAERHMERLAAQIGDRREAMEQAEAELRALFEEAGASDEASFAETIVWVERRRELQAEAKSIADRIAERIGTDEYAEFLKEQLETGEKARWETALGALCERLDAIALDRDTQAGDHREAQRALADLEASSDVPRSELELAAIVRKVNDAANRYRLVSYAQRLIADTLRRFERERQPEVLQRASEHLRALTGGVYQRLSLESDRQLVVTDSREVEHDPEVFSVGTKQQLYTCLRLALAENLADNGTDLPMVMDDVFVNFDPERAAEMARVLGKFVERRQILVFTCHPATADLLAQSVRETRRIDLPRYAGAGGPVGATVRTARVAASPRPAGDAADPGAASKVVALLAEVPSPQLKNEIVTATGLPEALVSRTLAQLRDEGAIATEGKGPGTRYKLSDGQA